MFPDLCLNSLQGSSFPEALQSSVNPHTSKAELKGCLAISGDVSSATIQILRTSFLE